MLTFVGTLAATSDDGDRQPTRSASSKYSAPTIDVPNEQRHAAPSPNLVPVRLTSVPPSIGPAVGLIVSTTQSSESVRVS